MNSSIITKMIPMKNNKIEIKLTSPLIKNPRNRISNAREAKIPKIFILLE